MEGENWPQNQPRKGGRQQPESTVEGSPPIREYSNHDHWRRQVDDVEIVIFDAYEMEPNRLVCVGACKNFSISKGSATRI